MDKVKDILQELEAKHDIEIIYAVEAGSRAWGLESSDSDYDIRFVYMFKNKRKYVSLSTPKQTIDGFSDDRLYDWQGWDIAKALGHVKQMNPSIAEWIYSPIVYLSRPEPFDFVLNAKKLLQNQKRLTPLLFHYRSMAKSNYKTHIQSKNDKVNIKKYLYVIRPAGMFEWLLKCKSASKSKDKLIEIDFNLVLAELKEHLTPDCYENIVSLIKLKKSGKETNDESRITSIDKWIDQVLSVDIDKSKEDGQSDRDELNEEYDKILHSILNIKFQD